jgi:magnesium transporter
VTEVLHGLDAEARERVAALRAQRRFFWLDASLAETSHDDLVAALDPPGHALRALAPTGDTRLSRTVHADGASIGFALRCYVRSEALAAGDGSRLCPLRVRVVLTAEYLLTVHEERVSLPAALAPELPPERGRHHVVYSVLDAMLASSFDALEEVELTLDALAATSTDGDAAPVPRATLQETGARLATMRRWVTTEQAVLGRLGVEIRALRGFDADEEEPFFDRLDEQVDRLLVSIDAAANGMGMLLDLQLNERAYLVSVVATIFVPLTFITGFFGMNFGWMVDQVDTPVAFWLLGLLVPIVTATLAWRLLVRRFLSGEAPNRRRG